MLDGVAAVVSQGHASCMCLRQQQYYRCTAVAAVFGRTQHIIIFNTEYFIQQCMHAAVFRRRAIMIYPVPQNYCCSCCCCVSESPLYRILYPDFIWYTEYITAVPMCSNSSIIVYLARRDCQNREGRNHRKLFRHAFRDALATIHTAVLRFVHTALLVRTACTIVPSSLYTHASARVLSSFRAVLQDLLP